MYNPRTTRAKGVTETQDRWNRFHTVTPPRMKLLSFMIDGWQYDSRFNRRGGNGYAPLNCLGGFGYDATVRRMVRDGEIRITRGAHHDNPFRGNPTINRTYAHVTDRGREVYQAWKKKQS